VKRRSSREAAGAQHLLREQRTDRDACGEAGAAQDLCQQQNRERPPLLSGDSSSMLVLVETAGEPLTPGDVAG
jgi:hypothetical protein